jgi:hypothetical protein
VVTIVLYLRFINFLNSNILAKLQEEQVLYYKKIEKEKQRREILNIHIEVNFLFCCGIDVVDLLISLLGSETKITIDT